MRASFRPVDRPAAARPPLLAGGWLLGAACVLFLGGVAWRIWALPISNYDQRVYLLDWYEYMHLFGGLRAIGDKFSDYNPPYLYLLYLAGSIAERLPVKPEPLYVIKLISVVFDVVATTLIYKLARLRYDAPQAGLCAAIFWVLPTVMINGAAWGQSDVIYTSFLLLSLYSLITKRLHLALAAFGIAISFKLQATFLGPLYLALLLRGDINWRHCITGIAALAATYLPALLAGVPATMLAGIYVEQTDWIRLLWVAAPNLYWIVPNYYYSWATRIGMVMTTLAALTSVAVFVAWRRPISPRALVAMACVTSMLVPFILPKMHDRYAFSADAMTFVFAIYFSRGVWVAVLMQLASFLCYRLLMPMLYPGWLQDAVPLSIGSAFATQAIIVLGLVLAAHVVARHGSAVARRMTAVAIAGAVLVSATLGYGVVNAASHRRAAFDAGDPAEVSPQIVANAVYGDELELVGFDMLRGRLLRNGYLELNIYHRVLRPPSGNYALRVELFDVERAHVRQVWQRSPQHSTLGNQPTSTWEAGSVTRIKIEMLVAYEKPVPLDLRARVSWVNPTTGAELPVVCKQAPCGELDGLQAFPRLRDPRP